MDQGWTEAPRRLECIAISDIMAELKPLKYIYDEDGPYPFNCLMCGRSTVTFPFCKEHKDVTKPTDDIRGRKGDPETVLQ